MEFPEASLAFAEFARDVIGLEIPENTSYTAIEGVMSDIASVERGDHKDIGVTEIKQYIHHLQSKENHLHEKAFEYLFNTLPKVGSEKIWDFVIANLGSMPEKRKSLKLRLVSFALSISGYSSVVESLKKEDTQEKREKATIDFLKRAGVSSYTDILPLALDILSVELGEHWIKGVLDYINALSTSEHSATYDNATNFLNKYTPKTSNYEAVKQRRKDVMEFPLFPVAITEADFDNNGETCHGQGIIFPEPIVDIATPCYRFEVLGKTYKGLIVEDYPHDAIHARLVQSGKSDMRQMKVCLEEALGDKSFPLNVFIHISYYVLLSGKKEVIFVLARKRK